MKQQQECHKQTTNEKQRKNHIAGNVIYQLVIGKICRFFSIFLFLFKLEMLSHPMLLLLPLSLSLSLLFYCLRRRSLIFLPLSSSWICESNIFYFYCNQLSRNNDSLLYIGKWLRAICANQAKIFRLPTYPEHVCDMRCVLFVHHSRSSIRI